MFWYGKHSLSVLEWMWTERLYSGQLGSEWSKCHLFDHGIVLVLIFCTYNTGHFIKLQTAYLIQMIQFGGNCRKSDGKSGWKMHYNFFHSLTTNCCSHCVTLVNAIRPQISDYILSAYILQMEKMVEWMILRGLLLSRSHTLPSFK